jgi:hypothetical protein
MRVLVFRVIQILISVVLFHSCHPEKSSGPDKEPFLNPPDQYNMQAYWQWMDGAVTREGITRDLEAMKSKGIERVALLCTGMYDDKELGIRKLTFAGDEWFGMFRWTLDEAARLGITVGMHNSNGWSGSGGPWISPEMSMKMYTWTKSVVYGGKDSTLHLPEPAGVQNFYRDVAVVAMQNTESLNKLPESPRAMKINGLTDASALSDGSPVTAISLNPGDFIDILQADGQESVRLSAIFFHNSMWGDPENFEYTFSIQESEDSISFRPLGNITLLGVNKLNIIDIPPVRAKHARLVLREARNRHFNVQAHPGEIELLSESSTPRYAPVVPDFLEKAAFVRSKQEQYYSLTDPFIQKGQASLSARVIDLTHLSDSSGTIRWNVPPGEWTVIRFGYTTTGASGNPVRATEKGLECDKMDTTALNLHFGNFPAELIRQAGIHAGNTFRFLLSDSYECSYTNWTGAFPSEFEKRRGYSIIPWIPVLCGEIIGSANESEAFLYDFRTTIAELIGENYYRHFATLCHRYGLEFHAEVIYGNYSYPPLDILKTNSYIDFPMTEFWTASDSLSLIRYKQSPTKELHLPVSASTLYGLPVTGAEAFTGLAHFSESLFDLKPFSDKAFCEGINQFVLHSYVHQPDERRPGFTLGRYASHFNRHNTYWPDLQNWVTYHARLHYMMQQGSIVSDVLYYLGDQLPQFNYTNVSNRIPPGYNLTACNFDVLSNHAKVKNGKIVLRGTDVFQLLSLSPFPFMNLETLKMLERLVAAGAIVYGPKPRNTLSLKDLNYHQAEFRELADRLWGENHEGIIRRDYKKGRIFWGMPLEVVLKEIEISPDLENSGHDTALFHFIHRKSGDIDIYFVANQQNKTVNSDLLFRITGKTPEIWDPETGETIHPALFSIEEGQTRIPATFSPYESLLFVFKPTKPSGYQTGLTKDGKTLFPQQDPKAAPPRVTKTGEGFYFLPEEGGNYTFNTSGNRNITVNADPAITRAVPVYEGSISFEPAYDAYIQTVNFEKPAWLTSFADPDIRFFSGKAQYSFKFDAPEDFLGSDGRIWLDLGQYGSNVTVQLNGRYQGSLWGTGSTLDVTGLLREKNEMVLTVSNEYRNRIIGDLTQFGELHNLWTTADIREFLSPESRLRNSGWAGPLVLKKYQPVSFSEP